jgi:hypothetical protein
MRVRILVLFAAAALVLGCAGCSVPNASPGSTTTSTPSAESTATTETAEAMRNSNPDAETLLTVADVEQASGLTGLKLVPRDSTQDAVGRLNFATADGTLIAILSIGDAVAFDQSLQGMSFARETTGTGDMSYVGPAPEVSKVLTIFAAAKGDHAVIMKTFPKTAGASETWLTVEQMQSLVGLALQRWDG